LLLPAGSLYEEAAAATGREAEVHFFVAIPSRLELTEGTGDTIKVIMSR